ncbi:MAG: hypothetical protein M1813_007536 [Trichoglossum hirsutum]|jgi:predicted esterase|nr:MAG: hypothetical protein M1813_007536 [Trichoglossum hirsutum]
METPFPEPWVIHPTAPHTHTFIILHGRGDTGWMFAQGFLGSSTSSGLTLPEVFPGMKFICPSAAPSQAHRLQRVVNQWFDVRTLVDPSEGEEVQMPGLRATARFLHGLIARETGEVPAKNIILGGLSQGCAAAFPALMALDEPLGAFVGMSGWLPLVKHVEGIIRGDGEAATEEEDKDEDEKREEEEGVRVRVASLLRGKFGFEPLPLESARVFQTPVFLGHGEVDATVDVGLGRQVYTTAVGLGMDATLKVYEDYGHWYLVPEELDDVAAFLTEKAGIARVGA